MALLWEVEMEAREGVEPYWEGSTLVTHFTKSLGRDRALVEADESTAAKIRGQPGVVSVERAKDGPYIDNSGTTYEVSGGGTRWSEFG
jgi:hypothetical protein